eukprot:TRINITY_DN73838_c0_g1_i1.p1 TRINITY_DN73838_c0_g1~~TRINITY_DN73838_c0_g1_i1.p1  ORF type:complete len:415 (+),score=62.14 TRINITY_DN73838_c0_g1_i1:46-1245(+)
MAAAVIADRVPQPLAQFAHLPKGQDAAYAEEALRLLNDEFVWFSLSEIRTLFDKFGCLYLAAWRALFEADTEGTKATQPLVTLEQPRGSTIDVMELRLGVIESGRLRAEVEQLQRWVQRQRSEFQEWADGLFFSFDRDGKEQLLDSDGTQVMMEWEKPYMERCIDVLEISEDSDVLEVGFGCGYSAERIQQARPRSHTIIECARPVIERLEAWAKGRNSVRIVRGTWQERLPELGVFSHIFFDDYGTPGRSEREMEEYCPEVSHREEYERATAMENGSHFLGFLQVVNRFHASPGSKFSGYLQHPIEPSIEGMTVSYERIPVSVPNHCNYFPDDSLCGEALVPLFVKEGSSLASDPSEGLKSRGDASTSRTQPENSSRGQRRSRSPRGRFHLVHQPELA